MYCPLYIKTDYSLLSSLIKVDDLIENLKIMYPAPMGARFLKVSV